MSNVGGNKKASSPSDQNYWKRAQAGKFAETHKTRRMERHAKRCKTTVKKIENSNGAQVKPHFPHIPLPRETTRVTFQQQVPEMRTFDEFGNVKSYPKFVIYDGVVVDILRVKA